MTRPRLIFALVLSIILVGGAGWIRLSRESTVRVENLVAVADTTEDSPDQIAATADVAQALSTPTDDASDTPLTDTSLIGRQMFSDFFGMVSNGQITPDNINTLASSYADSMGNLNATTRVSPTDLTLVADSTNSFNTYLTALDAIYAKYEDLIAAQNTDGKDLQSLGPDLIAWAQSMESIYDREASELKAIPVPSSLLELHVQLVNNYLSSKSAMHSLATAGSDPASAFGAIIVQSKNTDDEKTILSSIQDIVSKNGIISSNQ